MKAPPPDDRSVEDTHYYLYVREKVEAGIKAADAGKVVSEEEADRRINEWLASDLGAMPTALRGHGRSDSRSQHH